MDITIKKSGKEKKLKIHRKTIKTNKHQNIEKY